MEYQSNMINYTDAFYGFDDVITSFIIIYFIFIFYLCLLGIWDNKWICVWAGRHPDEKIARK